MEKRKEQIFSALSRQNKNVSKEVERHLLRLLRRLWTTHQSISFKICLPPWKQLQMKFPPRKESAADFAPSSTSLHFAFNKADVARLLRQPCKIHKAVKFHSF